jgi:WD repeat-containing protein 23
MTSDTDFDRLRLDRRSFGINGFDYRQSRYAPPRYQKHPVRPHRCFLTLFLSYFFAFSSSSSSPVLSIPRYLPSPFVQHDTSIMTYRGHSVLRTLIRCHFSPIATTSQRVRPLVPPLISLR